MDSELDPGKVCRFLQELREKYPGLNIRADISVTTSKSFTIKDYLKLCAPTNQSLAAFNRMIDAAMFSVESSVEEVIDLYRNLPSPTGSDEFTNIFIEKVYVHIPDVFDLEISPYMLEFNNVRIKLDRLTRLKDLKYLVR